MSKKSKVSEIKFNNDTAEYRFLLNEFSSPFYKGDILWQSASQYIAYAMLNPKGMNSKQATHNRELRNKITSAFDPFKCRYFLTKKGLEANSAQLREDSDKALGKILKQAVAAKFGQNPMLLHLLLQTSKATLVYANDYDDVLGSGRNGKGQNLLGTTITDFRDSVLSEYKIKNATDVFDISAAFCESILVGEK